MNSSKLFFRDGVRYELNNILEAARYCLSRSSFLQGKAASVDAAVELFVNDIAKQIQSGVAVGKMEQVFNAWFMLDHLSDFHGEVIRQVTVFIRPGRPPELRAVR